MRLVIKNFEILIVIVKDTIWPALDRETRQRERLAAQLLVGLLEVIGVQMAVTSRPDEIADQAWPRALIRNLGWERRQLTLRGSSDPASPGG